MGTLWGLSTGDQIETGKVVGLTVTNTQILENCISPHSVKTYTTEIQRILRDYYQKLDNLEEIDKLLDPYNLSKLNHEEMENLNKPI